MTTGKTVSRIDLARIFGALAVIMIHVAAPAVVALGGIGAKSWWLANLLDSASRWSVPLFVMVSGALLLDPKTLRPLPQFLQRRVGRVIWPLLFWSGLYFVWLAWWDNAPVDQWYVLEGFLAGVPYTHLYFLFLIFGLYLITPMLRIYTMHASRANAYYCLIVLLGLSALNTYIGMLWHFGGRLNMASQFVPFVGYYLAGYYLKNIIVSRRQRPWLLFNIGLLTGITAVGTYLLMRRFGIGDGLYLYEYTSITVIPITLLLYVWINSAFEHVGDNRLIQRYARPLRVLSGATFGIYLVHPLILDALNTFGISATSLGAPAGILATYVLAFIGSVIIIVSLQQIPGLRRMVL